MTKVNSVIGMEVMQEGRWMYWNFEKWLFWVVILTWIWPNSSPRLLSVQYVENKVTYMNCLHTWTERSIIVEFMVKFTWQHNLPVGSYCTFKMPSGRLDFWCSRAKNETPPLPPPRNSKTKSQRTESKWLLKYLITPNFCAKFQPNQLTTTFGPWNTFSDNDT